jgi:lipoate-protein ligase A
MARDSGLMDRARETGESVFCVYSWERPTLSLGRNQTARGRYDLDRIRQRGLGVVRRPTGGRALLHHREVTYSVTAPVRHGEALLDTYRWINRILLRGLERLGVEAAEASATEPAPRPGMLPCFATPGDGELVSRGLKLVGSAQVRENGSLLQHGSILIEDDQSIIAQVSLEEFSVGLPPAATLTGALGRCPSVAEVADALVDALAEVEHTVPEPLAEDEVAHFAGRYVERFSNELWTWRR